MREEWKPIQGFEGLYEISNRGEVRSLPKSNTFGQNTRKTDGKILVIDAKGKVSLSRKATRKAYFVAELMEKMWPNLKV